MATVLVILGKETSDFAKGDYNAGLFDTAISTLESLGHSVITTVIEQGYEPEKEIRKFKDADAIIFQYPVYWFMMPSSLKKYIDNVYAYGEFFGHGEGAYGSGGLMIGKQFMLSTTWNAPADVFNQASSFFEGKSQKELLSPMRYTQLFCGMDEMPHFSAHNVIHEPQFESDQKRLIEHLQTQFAKL